MITAKYLLKIWTLNVLMSAASLYLCNFYMPEQTLDDENSLTKFLNFGIDLLKMYWVMVFFVAMVFLSLTILLNLNKSIRNNMFLSFSTFLLIPVGLILYIIGIEIFSGDFVGLLSFIAEWLLPPFIYCLFTGVQFYFFREKVSRLKTQQ